MPLESFMHLIVLVSLCASLRLQGIGLWAWNGRERGQEASEYQLVDMQGRCGSRCAAAGAIASAMESLRWELWAAEDRPIAAILTNWENEAIFARQAVLGPPLPCTISRCRCVWNKLADFDTPHTCHHLFNLFPQ